MSSWAVRDRNDTWDAVCDRAWAGEPQFVTRGGTQTVVVISIQSYETKGKRTQHRILDALRSCPCQEDELFNAISDSGKDVPSYFERTGCFEEA